MGGPAPWPMAHSINRIQFLNGDLSGDGTAIRPPWARSEALFTEKCTRCGDCIAACPANLIVEGRGKFPIIDFACGACDFCQECVKACKPSALVADPESKAPPWNLKASIRSDCLSLNAVICRSCGEACDERAIRFKLEVGGIARPLLDQASCSGCGACFAVCPIRAVDIAPVQLHRKSA